MEVDTNPLRFLQVINDTVPLTIRGAYPILSRPQAVDSRSVWGRLLVYALGHAQWFEYFSRFQPCAAPANDQQYVEVAFSVIVEPRVKKTVQSKA